MLTQSQKNKLKKLGINITYFPCEQKYMAFKGIHEVTGDYYKMFYSQKECADYAINACNTAQN